MKKRIFSRVLALVMAMSLLSTTAFAVDLGQYIEEYDQNTEGYKNGFIYLRPVGGDSTFEMSGDVSTNKTLMVEEDNNITLEMNGHTLTHENNNNQVFRVAGQLTVDVVDGGVITGGNGVNVMGGAVYVTGEDSSFTMKGGEISGNKAAHGGAIFAADGATVDIDGTTIKDNEATKRIGGAIYALNATVNLKDATIEGNKAVNGGALGVEIAKRNTNEDSGKVTIENCTFKDNVGEKSIVEYKNVNSSGTLTGTIPAGTATLYEDQVNGLAFSVAENGIVTIAATGDEQITAICDANGTLIQNGTRVSGDLVLPLREATADDFPTHDDDIPEVPEAPGNVSIFDTAVFPANGSDATTTIEDEETPLAGLISTAELLEALREYEGIEDVELPEDFQWADHDYAQAIYWGLEEALVIDTEDAPLDPDEIVTIALLREVLENFVAYKGLTDFPVTVEGEDGMIVMDLGERLTVFYGELETALAAKAA